MILYRIEIQTDPPQKTCLVIPSTAGCCEIPLVAVEAKPCVHGNYARHLVCLIETVIGRSNVWCDGKPKEET